MCVCVCVCVCVQNAPVIQSHMHVRRQKCQKNAFYCGYCIHAGWFSQATERLCGHRCVIRHTLTQTFSIAIVALKDNKDVNTYFDYKTLTVHSGVTLVG